MAHEIIPYYVEINAFTLVLLIIIHINISRKTAYFSNEILYKASILTTMVAIVSDGVATLLEAKLYPGSILVNWILDDIYFLASLAIPYIYWAYVRSLANPKMTFFDWYTQLISVPYYVFALLLLTTHDSHLIFYIDEGNNYFRGPLRFLHGVIASFVLIITFIYTLYVYRKRLLPNEIRNYLLIMPLFPLFGVISRNLIQGSNLIWSCMTIGLLILYVHGQTSMIRIDSLTKLNNKGSCLEYLDLRMEKLHPGRKLFVTVYDINDFKYINDNFGHIEGDHAIVLFSDILKEVYRENRDFISRFGGDEFIVISERRINGSLEREDKLLAKKLASLNERHDLPYIMSTSTGTSSFVLGDKKTIEELINEADKLMYIQKQEFHK